MKTVWQVPDMTGMTVEQRFDSLFKAYEDEGIDVSMETLIQRNARIVLEGKGSIVITTPTYDQRVIKVLKSLGAQGRKIGPAKSTRFEWAIPLSQLEEFSRYLPGFIKTIDGFLRGAEVVEQNQERERNGETIEYKDLCNEDSAPGHGEIYRKCNSINVCIRHEPTSISDGCVMVVYRSATREEATCFKRTEMSPTVKRGSSSYEAVA